MKSGLSQEWLKGIACAAMLLDHIGAVFFPQMILFRVLGRLAFPLFCFLLAEGVAHTRAPVRYASRLAIGALLSEIPFDFLFYGNVNWQHQNVMITLLLGFAGLQVLSQVEHIWPKLIFVAGFAAAAQLLSADYGAAGVLLIYLFWVSRNSKWRSAIQTLGMILIFIPMGTIQLFGLLAMLPIWLYSGEKRYTGKVTQWGFYLFYPVHMAALYFLM